MTDTNLRKALKHVRKVGRLLSRTLNHDPTVTPTDSIYLQRSINASSLLRYDIQSMRTSKRSPQ